MVKIKWSNLWKWGEQKKNLAVILASCHSYFAFVCLCELLFPAQTPLCKQRRRDNWLTAQSAVASQASLIPHSGRSDWKMKDECSFPRERAGTLRLAVAPLCSPMGWGICFTKKNPAIAFKHEGIQIIQQTVSLLLHLDSTSLLGQFVRDFFFFYFETSNEES